MKCKKRKVNGGQCNSSAMSGSDFCYFHNPAISAEEKRGAQARGGAGRAKMLKVLLPEIKIKKVSDITILLVDTINQVRAGKMDVKMANCMGFLSDKLTKTMEVGNLAERFNKLEQLVMGKKHKF